MDEELTVRGWPNLTVIGADVTDVLFSHEHPDIQTVNITRILAAVKAGTILSQTGALTFDKEAMDRGVADRDIDPKVVEFLNANPDKLNEPILCALLADGSVLPIDGSHRCAVWASRGVYQVRGTVVLAQQLLPFRVRAFLDGVEKVLDREAIMRGYEFNKAGQG